jgi:hypothetical protein
MPLNSVVDLPGFPFETFAEFQDAYQHGKALVWTRYSLPTLWELWRDDPTSRALHVALMAPAVLSVPVFTGLAVASGDYHWLWGIPSALVGALYATPNPGCFSMFVPCAIFFASFVASLFRHHAAILGMLSPVSPLVYMLASAGLGTADVSLRELMMASEERFLWLHARGVVAEVAKVKRRDVAEDTAGAGATAESG